MACCHSCSPVVFLEGPFIATGVGVEAQEGGSPGLVRPGRLPWWQWSFLIPSWPHLLGCLGGFAFPRMWQEVGHLIPPTCPCKYFCAMATLLGRFSASL